MRTAFALLLLFSIAFYFFFDKTLGATLFALSMLALALSVLLRWKSIAKKMHSDMAKAEPRHPSASLIQEAFNEAGKKGSEQLWQSGRAWTSKNVPKRLGKSSQNLIDKFFELFK